MDGRRNCQWGTVPVAAKNVLIYYGGGSRSRTICHAMQTGIKKAGMMARLRDQAYYRTPKTRIAVHYGLSGNLRKIWTDHQKDGHTSIYIDLGYWGRREGGRFRGYHKFVINGRHPTEYFQNRQKPGDRFKIFKLKIQDYRKRGDAVLIAGMSGKAAKFEGFGYLEWEKNAIAELRKHTDREIIYRPKPGKSHGTDPIEGTTHSPRSEKLESVLRRTHAVVSHHSNVNIDGLIRGVPSFCVEGVAVPMSLGDLSQIENAYYPPDRERWLNDIAYCQFSVAEMASGLAWKTLMEEGIF
jgi:hypothetical protein